jgi:hypothetical protein
MIDGAFFLMIAELTINKFSELPIAGCRAGSGEPGDCRRVRSVQESALDSERRARRPSVRPD